MPDNPVVNPDLLSKLESLINRLITSMKGLGTEAGGTANNFKYLEQSAEKATAMLSQVKSKIAETVIPSSVLGEVVNDLAESWLDLLNKNEKTVGAMANTVTAISMFSSSAKEGISALNGLGKGFEFVNKSSQEFADISGKIALAFAPKNAVAQESIKKMIGLNTQYINIVGSIKQFEASLLSAAQTSGNFYNIAGKSGEVFIKNMDQTMALFSKRAAITGTLVGVSFEEAMSRTMKVMSDLPGEFDRAYKDITVGTESHVMKTTQLLSMISRGVGVSFEDAAQITKGVLDTFGENSLDAAKRMGVLSTASKETGIRFSDIRSLVEDTDSSFALWGNQMEGVVGILQNVSSALDDTNVGFKGQIAIVKSLQDAVRGMQLPMKAFIGLSSQMRGPGGAVGVGLNVERMLQEGRMGEVVGMMQQTLEKVSGRGAVSLQEAAESPTSQRAFMVQRGMLGQMGIGDTATQNRILEAMSKADLGGTGMIDAQNALKEALTTGDDIAKRQTDEMANLSENLIKLNQTITGISFYEARREATAAVGRGGLFTADKSKFARGEMARDEGLGLRYEDASKAINIDRMKEETGFQMMKALTGSFVVDMKAASNGLETVIGSTGEHLAKLDPALDSAVKGLKGAGEAFANVFAGAMEKLKEDAIKTPYFSGPHIAEPSNEPSTPRLRAAIATEIPAFPATEPTTPQTTKVQFEPAKVTIALDISREGKLTETRVIDLVMQTLSSSQTNSQGA